MEKYKIFIPGGKGMLGCAINELFLKNKLEFKIADLPEFDVRDENLVREEIIKYKPTHILNLSAYTKVDKAEEEREEAFGVNEKGVENLCNISSKLKIKLIHISTDYVFNGEKEGEWTEEDEPSPINIYGLSKLKGEEAVKKLDDFLIIRTSWLFGKGGQNFVKTIALKLKKKEDLKVIMDQRGCPTYTKFLATAILFLIKNNAKGIYHICQPPPTTWYDFALKIKEILKVKDVNIYPVSSDEYKTPAKRPKNSILSTKKFLKDYNYKIPSWEESLKDYLEKDYE